MSFNATKKLIDIVDYFIKAYENSRQWFKKKSRAWRSRNIRNAVDKHDVGAVHNVIRKILKRRRDRQDEA